MPIRSRQQPQIDPFAFPAETNGRFNMLILGILMIATYTSAIFAIMFTFLLNLGLFRDFEWMLYGMWALDALQGDRNLLTLSGEEARQIALEMQQIAFAAFITGLPRVGLFVIYVLTLVGVAYAIYRSHLWAARRMQQFRPLTAFTNQAYAESVARNVSQIAASVGVTPPQVMIKKHPINEGQALGLPGRYMIGLTGWPWYGLDELTDLWRRSQKHDQFRALVLHELGHIKNHDVGRAKFAEAIFWSFVGLVLLPLIIMAGYLFLNPLTADAQLLIQPNNVVWTGASLVRTIAQIIALLLVIYASYAALLRVREFYADWRCELWGAGAALRNGLRNAPAPARSRRLEGILARLPGFMQQLWQHIGGWWRYHSSPQERIARLNDPRSLFKVSSELGFQTGVLLGFVQVGLLILVAMYLYPILAQINDVVIWTSILAVVNLPTPLDEQAYALVLIVIRLGVEPIIVLALSGWVAYLVTESLGQQVMRAAIADLIPGIAAPWGYVTLLRPAFWLAVGHEVSFLIIPQNVFTIYDTISLAIIPVLALLFTFFSWLWLICVRVLSRALLGTYAGTSPPRLRRWLVTAVSTIMLWAISLPILPMRVTVLFISEWFGPRGMFYNQITSMWEFIPYWMLMLVILVTVGFVLFVICLVISLGAAWLWSLIQPPRCPACRELAGTSTTIGQHCSACYCRLDAWLYLSPGRRT